jgi:hypothetical protein
VKKEPKIPMGATRRNFFLRSKMKINLSYTNSFSDPKEEVSNLKASFKNGGQNFYMDSHQNTADGDGRRKRRTTERRNFFFRKNRFFSDKKS